MSPFSRDKGKDLCGTTLVPYMNTALEIAVSGEPGEAYFDFGSLLRGDIHLVRHCLAPMGDPKRQLSVSGVTGVPVLIIAYIIYWQDRNSGQTAN